jgi:hypothetical protein
MTREFESLTKRFDEGYLKNKKAAAGCRMANMLVEDVLSHGAYELPEPVRQLIIAYSDIATPPWTAEPPGARQARWYMRREISRGGSSAYHMRGMQRYLTTRASYRGHHVTTHPPDDGNGAAGVGGVVDQMTRDTDYAKATGRERRWDDHLLQEGYTHRDPKVKREGNDVTQAAFQSPTAHLADCCYERLIFSRDQLSSLFGREEEGAERTVQMALLWAVHASRSTPPSRCSKQACTCNRTWP